MISALHLRKKKDGNQIIKDTKLSTIQDDKESCINPDLLDYCRKMPAYLFTNWSIKFGMINKSQTIAHGFILNP